MAAVCQARQWCSTLALCRQDAQGALAGCAAGRCSQPPAALENRASSKTPPVVPRILRRKPLVRCPGAPKHCRTKCQERPHRASGHAAAAREQRQGEAEMWGRKRSWVSSNGWALGWCIRKGCSGTTHIDCVDDRLPLEVPVHSLCVAEPGQLGFSARSSRLFARQHGPELEGLTISELRRGYTDATFVGIVRNAAGQQLSSEQS